MHLRGMVAAVVMTGATGFGLGVSRLDYALMLMLMVVNSEPRSQRLGSVGSASEGG